MQDAQYQTDALDQYVDALLRDPDTPPPSALDAETAAVAKALVESKSSEAADDRTKDRVWSRVLFAAYAPPDLEPSYHMPDTIAAENSMESTGLYPKRKPQRLDVTFLVAAAFAVLCLTGLFVQYTDSARANLSRYQATKPAPRQFLIPYDRLMPGEINQTPATLVMDQDTAREMAALPYYTAALIPE